MIDVELADVYRIIPARFAADPLGCVPSPSRFSDPAGDYAVLYAGHTVRCALWETLLRDDFLDGSVSELPVPTAVTRDRRHAAGRSLSRSVHERVPEADGIVYDSRFVSEACVVVYDRALGRLDAPGPVISPGPSTVSMRAK